MIPSEIRRNIEKIGEWQETGFTIKATAKSFRLLIAGLYPNAPVSVLKELGQNCADSHKLVGKENIPFEVTLPTYFSPNLIVRDFGVGISHDYMMKEYTQVFHSSKDNSDDQTGGYGVGRVSALSLCDSYIVESYQNGIKYIYTVFYNDVGIPAISFLGQEETIEPNGLLVNIPVAQNRCNEFINAALDAFKYYEMRPIIKGVNDFIFPKHESLIESEDKSFSLLGKEHTSVAWVSYYAYPIDKQSLPDLSPLQEKLLDSGIVMKFTVKEVKPTVGRDAIQYTPETIQNIKNRLDEIIPKIQPVIAKQFEGKNIFEKSALKYDLLSYDGKLASISELVKEFLKNEDIPHTFSFEGFNVTGFTKSYHRGKYRVRKSESNSIEFNSNVVLYFADRKSHLKLKADKFFSNIQNQGKRLVFVCPEENDAVANFQIKYGFDLTTLPKSSSLPFEKPVAGDREFNVKSFNGYRYRYNNQNMWVDEEDFDENDDIIYVERNGYEVVGWEGRHSLRQFNENVKQFHSLTNSNQTIYGLTARQIAKKKPHWKTFAEAFNEVIQEWTKNQEEKIATYKYFKQNYCNFPSELEKLKLDANSLAAQIKFEYDRINEIIKGINQDMAAKSQIQPSANFQFSTEKLKEKYPLLFHLDYGAMFCEHTKKDLEDYIVLKS